MALKLEDDSTHFVCASCNEIKQIDCGNVVKVAYSLFNDKTQDKFYYRPYYVMLCDKCLKGEENDGDTDTKKSKKNKKGKSV